MNKCDLCNNTLPQTEDNVRLSLESCIKIIDDIDDSLKVIITSQLMNVVQNSLLCDYCQKEYLLPAY